MKTSIVSGLAAAAISLALAGPTFAQDANVTGELHVVGFSGVFADNYQKFIIAPFEQQYPGIKVDFQPSKNSAETLALLTLQKGNPTVDIALIDVAVAIKANQEGLFAPLDPKVVTNLADTPDWARIDGDRSIAFSQDNLAILYNTKTVTEPPTSWNDLKDPKYKGRIAAPPTVLGEGMPEPVEEAVLKAVEDTLDKNKRSDPDELSENVRRASRRAAQEAWGKKPITRVLVSEL